MTRTRMYLLTAISAALYVFLTWAFADGLFSLDGESIWNTQEYSGSTLFTYLILAVIIVAGVLQVQRLPEGGVELSPETETETPGQTDDPKLWKLLLGNAYLAVFWLPIRFFVGREWLTAGEHKLRDEAWMDTGAALVAPGDQVGFWERVVAIPEPPARPSITYGWYRDVIQYMIDNEWHTWFAPLIAIGEFLVGVGLIVGALVGIAAFFGTLMNFSFMMAGTASSNPVLFGVGVFLILAWKVAGYWGLDRYLLPSLGAPWKFGTLIKEHHFDHMVPGGRPRATA